jgi:hypothetical protein
VLLEAPDGNWQQHLLCTSLEVLNAADGRTLFRLAGIRARASLTDARLTVACSNFEKGGGWLGGPLALAVNLASRVRARRRRRGGVLVGQVRYESIRAVYAQNKAGWVGSELLRVVVDDGGRDLHVELTLPRDLDAAAVAGQLIRRAAAFRLGTATDAQERRRLAELAQLPPLVCERGSGAMAGATFPAGRGGAW